MQKCKVVKEMCGSQLIGNLIGHDASKRSRV